MNPLTAFVLGVCLGMAVGMTLGLFVFGLCLAARRGDTLGQPGEYHGSSEN
jgi:hypothetical protein